MYEPVITTVGRVATAVSLRRFEGGGVKASFRLACTERRRDWTTGEWADGDTTFMTVYCWRGMAENVHASLGVGDPIVVRGKLRTRAFESEGKQGIVIEVEATEIGPDLGRCSTVVRRPSPVERADGAGEKGQAGSAESARALVGAGAGGQVAEVPMSS
ncbi:single-strand DNA-binding protein [Pseudonocardia thermophila]|jgi:single stranded DNA-binding protein (ssb)|uniref:Single-stranded DNA-binding protein n=1 Tax=Pseudonocardia thermophila TaxID=1848 RepID=A0A1M6WMJ1_PSETH|nr:single-stranded DNA-binding protein [Pseudonocardia thermophila]SHK94918.1 single-strand DNA-binding protein [Pseudonocardia thermophila]